MSGKTASGPGVGPVMEGLDARRLMSVGPGNLDFTFNFGNTVTPAGDLAAGRVVDIVQRNESGVGSVWVLTELPPAEATEFNGQVRGGGFAITKYNPTGTLDLSFGDDGRLLFNLGLGVSPAKLLDLGIGNGFFVASTAYRPTVIPDGSGGTDYDDNSDFLLTKVAENGLLDTSFNAGKGYRAYELGGDGSGTYENVVGAAVTPDGGVVIGGIYQSARGAPESLGVLKVAANGNRDAGFGEPGMTPSTGVTVLNSANPFVPATGPQSVLVGPSGGVYIGGTDPFQAKLSIIKLTAAGVRDNGWAISGQFTYNAGGNAEGRALAMVDTTGDNVPDDVLIAGLLLGQDDIQIVAYGVPNGAGLRTSFGSTGAYRIRSQVSGEFSEVQLRQQPGTNRINVALNQVNGDPLIARITTDGALDTSGTAVASRPLGLPVTGPVLMGSGRENFVIGGATPDNAFPQTSFTSRLTAVSPTLTAVGTFSDGLGPAGTVTLNVIPDAGIGSARAVSVDPVNGEVFTFYTNEDPVLEGTFGTYRTDRNGVLLSAVNGGSGLFHRYDVGGIVRLAGGGHLVAFSAYQDGDSYSVGKVILAKFTPGGLLDGTFGAGGLMVMAPGGTNANHVVNAVALSPDGASVYVAGNISNARALYKFSVADGSLEGSYTPGTIGLSSFRAIEIDAVNGKIYLGYEELLTVRGLSGRIGQIERLNLSSLAVDTNYGSGGNSIITLNGSTDGTTIHSLKLDPANSRLLVGGSYSPSNSVAQEYYVAAINPNTGNLITGFGTAGTIQTLSGAFQDGAYAIQLDPAGGFLVAGAIGDKPSLRRYTTNGTLDAGYGQTVPATTDLLGRYLGLQIDAAGRPVVVGESTQLTGAPRPAIVRRFGATATVRPTVTAFVAETVSSGDGQGVVTVTFQAPTGLRINIDSLASAVQYTQPGSSTSLAAVLDLGSVTVLDDGRTVQASYYYQPVSDPFGEDDNGTYSFSVLTALADDGGNTATFASIGTSVVNLPPAPTAALVAFAPPRYGAGFLDITVDYSDASGLDPMSIRDENLLVEADGEFGGTITVVSVTQMGVTGLRVVYRFVPDGGPFTEATNSEYIISINSDAPPESTSGERVPFGELTRFTTSFARPTAIVMVPPPPRFEAGGVSFTVRYTATAPGAQIDVSTISALNVGVLLNGLPTGQVITAMFGGGGNATFVDVTYTFIPEDGTFTTTSNGSYAFQILSGAPVTDTSGTPVNGGLTPGFVLDYVRPTVSVVGPAPAFGASAATFKVAYRAADFRAIDTNTLGNNNISILAPNGARLAATLVSFETNSTGETTTATYSFTPAGGSFGTGSSGTYTLDPGASRVLDLQGAPAVMPSGFFSFQVQFTAPTAAVQTIGLPAFGGSEGQIIVVFTPAPGRGLDLSSLGDDDLVVTYPDGSTAFLRLTMVTWPGQPPADGPNPPPLGVLPPDVSATAVYVFVPRAGASFGFASEGEYTFAVAAGSVRQGDGVTMSKTTLATTTLSYLAPTASAPQNVPAPSAGATAYTFTVTYTAAAGRSIVASTLGDDDLEVLLPGGGTAPVTFVSAGSPDGNSLTVTYRFSPVSGTFDAGAVGTYTVRTVAGAVADSDGVPVKAATVFATTFALPESVIPAVASINFSGGSFLPGAGLAPTVTVSNPSQVAPSQAYLVRFLLTTPSGVIALGDVMFDPIAAGGSRTVNFAGRVSLPSSATLVPGSYTLSAQVVSTDGAASTAPVSAGNPIVVVAPAPPKPGTLDPNFGGGSGVVTSFVPGPVLTLVGSVTQPGQVLISGGYNDAGDFVLIRFKADGTRDSSFGDNGVLTIDVSGGTDIASAIFGDAQGRILLGGTSTVDGTTKFAVVRFLPDGTLDTSFNGTGKLLYAPGGASASILRSITADNFGRPYLLGSVQAPQTENGAIAPQGAVIRLTPFGTVDVTFGALGVISAAFSNGRKGVLPFADGRSELTSLLLLPNRIIVGGYSGTAEDGAGGGGGTARFAVAALAYSGALDVRFGSNGVYASEFGTTVDRVTTLLGRTDGAVYVAGSRATGGSATAVLFRLTAAGKIDRTFNRGQVLALDTGTVFGTVSSVLGSVNDTVLVTVATTNSLTQAAAGQIGTVLFRITPTGGNDPLFNGGSPLVLFAVPQPPAALSVGGDFDSFVQSKQGSIQMVEGGFIRAIASTPITGSGNVASDGTAVSIVQLSPDGIDLSALLTGNLPATVRPGFKGTVTLTVANVGSSNSSKRFSIRLIGDNTDSAGPDLMTIPDVSIGGRFVAGTSRTVKVRVNIPKTAPAGTYRLIATIANADDVNQDNDTATHPSPLVITPPPGRSSAATLATSRAAGSPGLFSGSRVGEEEETLWN